MKKFRKSYRKEMPTRNSWKPTSMETEGTDAGTIKDCG
jgi:hypothetical protein